jgi:hypothetical protein
VGADRSALGPGPDELQRRQDRLLARRIQQARFRDANKTLDGFDFRFNPKIDRALVFELATGRFVERAEDAVFLGASGSTSCSKSSPTRRSTAPARTTSPSWPACRC